MTQVRNGCTIVINKATSCMFCSMVFYIVRKILNLSSVHYDMLDHLCQFAIQTTKLFFTGPQSKFCYMSARSYSLLQAKVNSFDDFKQKNAHALCNKKRLHTILVLLLYYSHTTQNPIS